MHQHQWPLCGNLKVVALLLSLQVGYTKYCCFTCKWDSRTRAAHYVRQNWPMRHSLEPGQKSVQHPLLVQSEKILLPPLHIKLGLMKNFVKAMDKLDWLSRTSVTSYGSQDKRSKSKRRRLCRSTNSGNS